MDRNLGIKDDSKVTKDWLLLLLSTLNPEHYLFHPSYYPKPPKTGMISFENTAILKEVQGLRATTKGTQRAQQQVLVQGLQTQVSSLTHRVSQMNIQEENQEDSQMITKTTD